MHVADVCTIEAAQRNNKEFIIIKPASCDTYVLWAEERGGGSLYQHCDRPHFKKRGGWRQFLLSETDVNKYKLTQHASSLEDEHVCCLGR